MLILLQVLVEYDEVEWHRREWISVYKDGLFHLFLVEQGLCWGERTDPFTSSQTTVLWPTLVSIFLQSLFLGLPSIGKCS